MCTSIVAVGEHGASLVSVRLFALGSRGKTDEIGSDKGDSTAETSGSSLWYNGIMLRLDHSASEPAMGLTPDSSRRVSLLLAKETVDDGATR